ncbi:MAG TPA: hypothetical protein VG759_21970 [Candidatus Angelobacter sp.]|jgi:hypothetical protein|nr:hypothetical protein [Candidatus Angelobacter sp.]
MKNNHVVRKSPKRWQGHLLMVFCALCVVTISVNLWRNTDVHANSPVQHRFLHTGDTIGPLTVRDVAGKSRALFPAKTNFVLYYGKATAKSLQNATYAGFLARRNDNPSISFVIAANKSFQAYQDLYSTATQDLFLVHDEEAEIANRLGLASADSGSAILDQDGKVLFGAPGLLDPEDLRQLYERYSRGKIDYSIASQSSTALVGKAIPAVQVREIHSGKVSTFSEVAKTDSAEYWVFTANCPVCSLRSFFEALAQYRPQHPVIPVFSSRLPLPVLLQVAKENRYDGPIYIAETEISGFEDIYNNQSVSDFISIVKVDSHDRIVSAIPVSPFEIQEVLRSHEN